MKNRASLRDASWYNRPECRKTKVYHVRRENCEDWWSSCGRSFLQEKSIPIKNVPEWLKCQRPGCKERW